MRFLFLSLLAFFTFATGQAKTILVSDIDDTVKLANVQNLGEAAYYSFDDSSRFLGMSELYSLIKKDNSDLDVFYLSKAPSWLMAGTHTRLLKNGHFPEGQYIPRTSYPASLHKIFSLRDIIDRTHPDQVIFFGDNGEQDSPVYEQIKNEYQGKGIHFLQFIRLVYASQGYPQVGVLLAPDQIGFVSPIEVSLELKKAGVLSQQSVQWMLDNVMPLAASELPSDQQDEVPVPGAPVRFAGIWAFPEYVRCNDFIWKWDDVMTSSSMALARFKNKLMKFCSNP